MVSPRLTRLLIDAMAKHLPPSASTLRLLDVGGFAGDQLREQRADLDVLPITGEATAWALVPESVDAVVAFDPSVDSALLAAALDALRPGGRLIMMQANGDPDQARVLTLENAGYTRILVEVGVECPLPTGVLMRGEKPHRTADTHERIQGVAQHDADAQTLANFRGRYVHLLVIQTPNKPVWALEADETLIWQAATLDGALLAFSSLPKAIAFMQPAVMRGIINDVNKVAKFSKATAQTWTLPLLVNPSPDALDALTADAVGFVPIDPTTAEDPDE